jgi:hypothetical protein
MVRAIRSWPEKSRHKPLEYLTRGAGEDGMSRQILWMGGCGRHRCPAGVKERLTAGEVRLIEAYGSHWPPGVVLQGSFSRVIGSVTATGGIYTLYLVAYATKPAFARA